MHAPGEGARDGLAEDGVVLAEPDAPRRSHSCEPPAARRPPPAARRRRLLAGRPRRQRCPCQIGLEEEAAMSSKTLLRLPAHDPAVAARIELDAHHMTLAGQPLAAPRPLASCHENLPTLETPSATENGKPRNRAAFTCAEEDSNLHPLSVDQALNLVTRVSDPSDASRTSDASADLDEMDGVDDVDVATAQGRDR